MRCMHCMHTRCCAFPMKGPESSFLVCPPGYPLFHERFVRPVAGY
jgi:hypothetical protein